MGIRRHRIGWGIIGCVLFASACATPHEPRLSEQFMDQLETMRDESGSAVRRAVERQREAALASSGGENPSIQDVMPGETIWVQSGKSKLIRLPGPARRVSLGNPDIAGLVVVGPRTIVINGKLLPEPEKQTNRLQLGAATILGGTLTAEPRFLETTLIVWRDDEMDVHPLIIGDFIPQQVMLEVTVAEVNRTALEQHGIDFRVIQDEVFAAGWMGAGLPPGFLFPPVQQNQPLLPLNAGNGGPTYALVFPDENAAMFLRALQTEGLARILAQPKLTAMSGQTAVFQVGGEIPIRVSSGFVAEVEFKPFGTLVNFVPRVTDQGDIFLTVTPEVSEADFAQTVEGIPTFRTRRASTSAKLRDGETLVIGGLMQSRIQEEVSGVPYLKDVPYLGYAFRTTRYTEEVTELMVVVKPTFTGALAPGVDVDLPTARGPLTHEELSTELSHPSGARPRLLPAAEKYGDEEPAAFDEPAEATEPELPVLR